MSSSICTDSCYLHVSVPEKGRFIAFCEHNYTLNKDFFDELKCNTCKGHHCADVTCEEYADICDHYDDEDEVWWREQYLAFAHWHDSVPCWTYCEASHSHINSNGEEVPCYDTGCKRCPVCAGRMDPGEWGGRGCSRSCAMSR